jgi:hypothetical protein
MATVKTCDVQEAQVKTELDQTLKAADPVRADSLLRLQRVRSARTKNQEREKLRLTEKLGGEHPRVMVLQAKIDTNYEVTRNLNLESVRARTEVPRVESDDWLVHGRVMSEQGQPVTGMKAALYDSSGCPIETCGSEITDKTGYFNLTIKNVGKSTRTPAEIKKKKVDEAREANTTVNDNADDCEDKATANKNREAFVYVLDRSDVILHRDKRPLAIAPGQVQYLEIVLDDADVDRPTQPKTRYLGNSSSRELHDLNNQKPACQIDEIRVDHRINFKTQIGRAHV